MFHPMKNLLPNSFNFFYRFYIFENDNVPVSKQHNYYFHTRLIYSSLTTTFSHLLQPYKSMVTSLYW